MKTIIPINAVGECSPTITAHYHKAGGKDFMPRKAIDGHKPEIAILVIDEIALQSKEIDECRFAPVKTENRKEIMEEPKIMQIGSYSPSSKCNAKVLDADGICPTLLDHKGAEPDILTQLRTPEGRERAKQGEDDFSCKALYPRKDGISNCLTSVVKDNLLQEPCIIGYTRDDKGNVESYHEKEIAGTIHTSSGSGGNTDQFVREQVIGSMQANAMRGSLDGVSPCLTEAMGMGGGQIPMIVQRPHGNNPGGIKDGDIAPTITTSAWQDNNHVVEPCGLYDNLFGEFAREPVEGLARTLKADPDNAVMLRYKVRKLTPRECYRLQDVDDTDIDKLFAYRLKTVLKDGSVKEKPIPKSRHYALAGNSITVAPLYHIFYQMFIAEPPKPHTRQLSIFDEL